MKRHSDRKKSVEFDPRTAEAIEGNVDRCLMLNAFQMKRR
jgi:hypothetical protein